MRTKKELRALEPYQMSLAEFTWAFAELLCFDHYHSVEQALKDGKHVDPKVLACYPSLKGRGRKPVGPCKHKS